MHAMPCTGVVLYRPGSADALPILLRALPITDVTMRIAYIWHSSVVKS